MWISTVLFARHVPGRIFSGKHRVAMKVTKYQRKRANKNNHRIENNKELLSYPYLTVAEDHCHAYERNVKRRKEFFDSIKRNRTLGKETVYNINSSGKHGFLNHLNVVKKT